MKCRKCNHPGVTEETCPYQYRHVKAPAPLVRPEFVAQMEAELQANQHKGDWNRWYPTVLQVLAEIQHHQGKLMLALSAGDCERVKEYAADLANFAMKVDEQFGGPLARASGSAPLPQFGHSANAHPAKP